MVKRSRISKLGFTALTLILVLGLVEVVVLSAGVFEDDLYQYRHAVYYKKFQPDAELGYKFKPNLRDLKIQHPFEDLVHTINSDEVGFSNVGKQYNSADLLFIGDSFTQGSFVEQEQRFFSVIDKALGGNNLNLAIGGYAFEQYQTLAEQWMPKLKPETLVLCLFANDLRELQTDDFISDYYHNTSAYKFEAPKRYWARRTLTYNVYSALFHNQQGPVMPDHKKMANGLHLFKEFGAADPDYIANGIYIGVEQAYVRIHELCNQQGVQLVTVLIPPREVIYQGEYAEFWPDAPDYPQQTIQGYERIERLSEVLNIPVLNLVPAIKAASATEPVYFALDGHFNARGHKAVADAMLEAFWNT